MHFISSDLMLDPQVAEAFRAYSMVKEVRIARDRLTNASRGFCFVEFPTVEVSPGVINDDERRSRRRKRRRRLLAMDWDGSGDGDKGCAYPGGRP
jgi:hypothetical protein